METTPSVQDRKRNLHPFMKVYSHLCTLHNVVPNASIKVEANNILDLTGDRLKIEDWKPVLEAIRNDRSLHYISIRSKHKKYKGVQETKKGTSGQQVFTPKSSPSFTNSTMDSILCTSKSSSTSTILHETRKECIKRQICTPKSSPSFTNSTIDSLTSASTKYRSLYDPKGQTKERQVFTPNLPPLVTTSTIYSLTEALSMCLMHSQTITGLLLENIILSCDSLNKLIQGLEVSKSLQQLSLPFTMIGDEGFSALCHILRNRLNLVWINLTGCNLTDSGIESLCKLLKFQKLNRYGESWKQSLRCRKVNPNIMPGLRRVTLCHNAIGDAGVKILVETLIDDLWVKALDLQDCHVTSVGGKDLLNLVMENQCLSVVDIRGNKEIPSLVVEKVTQILFQRNSDVEVDFPWLKEDSLNTENKSNISCRSKSTQKSKLQQLYSNPALSILPSKVRKMIPNACSSSVCYTRLCSSKSIQNQKPSTPQCSRNSNNNSYTFQRGKSDTNVSTKKSELKFNDSTEIHSLKEELKKMSCGLQEEINKRTKVEKELYEYKTIIELSKNINQKEENIKNYNDTNKANIKNLERSNSLESLINTLNEGGALLSPQHNSCGHTSDSSFSKPHMMFETLLSN